MKFHHLLFSLALISYGSALRAEIECLTGIYTVPQETGNRDAAAFPMKYCLDRDEGGELNSVSYEFPSWLVPAEQAKIHIEVVGKSELGFLEMESSTGFGTCAYQKTRRLLCIVMYPHINFDPQKHLQSLVKKGLLSREQLSVRGPVTEIFAHEPEGIIELRF